MTYALVNESGQFRNGEEGVFDGDKCIFMAPPAHFVPSLIDDLFKWMNREKNNVHPLILSSVFHYEFVFIHPFSDGNGRMARLWQTAILTKWKPIFNTFLLKVKFKNIRTDITSQFQNAILRVTQIFS